MTTIKPQDAMHSWLNTVPLEELVSEESVEVVESYRDGDMEYDYAMMKLWEKCAVELEEWVKFNIIINANIKQVL